MPQLLYYLNVDKGTTVMEGGANSNRILKNENDEVYLAILPHYVNICFKSLTKYTLKGYRVGIVRYIYLL